MTEPSKPKHAGRRVAEPEERPSRRAATKPTGGARIKAPEPVRRNRTSKPSRFAWARTTAGQVGICVAVLLIAVVARFAATAGGDDKPRTQDPVGAGLTPYGNDWKTKDGHSYGITVTPLAELVSDASTDSCIPAPGPGRTNLRFAVRIDNKGDDAAPVPEVRFAVNLTRTGTPADLAFEKQSKNIDINQPNVSDCDKPALLRASQDMIGAKSAAIFSGLIGNVKKPVKGGIALTVRYTQADAGSPSGSSTEDLIVRIPDLSSLS